MTEEQESEAAEWLALGVAHQENGEPSAAAADFRRCLALEPANLAALWRLAFLEATLERRLSAVGLFERLLTLDPSHTEAKIQLAHLDAGLGWLDRAHARLAGLGSGLPGWWEQTRQDRLAAVRRQRERLAALESRGGAAPADLLELAAGRLALGHLPACAAALRRLDVAGPLAADIAALTARLILRRDGLDAAIAFLRAQPARLQTRPKLLLALARLLHEAADPAGLEAALLPLAGDLPMPMALHLLTLSSFATGDAQRFQTASARWLQHSGGETRPCVFALAAARARGAIASLASSPAQPAPDPATARPILLQFWHSSDIPADVASCLASWQQHNPHLDHRVMSADDARAYLAAHARPEVLTCFDEAQHPAAQSDIIRLAVLAREGGAYVDADERCVQPIAPLLAALLHIEFVGWMSQETPPYLYNGFIACGPRCPIVTAALDEMVALRAAHRAQGIRSDIWQVSGPGLITRAVARHAAAANAGNVMLLTDREFRSFSRTDDTLAYKTGAAGNWRLA